MMKDTHDGQTHHAMCWEYHHECAKALLGDIRELVLDYQKCKLEVLTVNMLAHRLNMPYKKFGE